MQTSVQLPVDPALQYLLRIGDTTLGGNPWNGQLDDLRIYRRALSQSEIAALHAAPDVMTFPDWVAANLTAPPAGTRAEVLPGVYSPGVPWPPNR